MSRKINVIAVHHQWALVELAMSIVNSLNIYGFEAKYYEDVNKQIDFNVFVSGQDFHLASNDNINIQVETDHIELDKQIKRSITHKDYFKYTRSLHFFDYKENLEHENIYYCPIGYSKYFDTNIKREELRDSFHMGRASFSGPDSVRTTFRNKYKFSTINGPGTEPIIGGERDKLIVTTKVNVNSRLYEDYWFTPLHAALIIHKGKLLLQDDCGKDDYNWYKDYMILFTEEDFNDKIKHWINNNKERREFEAFIYKEVKEKHPFEKYFYEAVGDLLDKYI